MNRFSLGEYEDYKFLTDEELVKFRHMNYVKQNMLYANKVKFIIIKSGKAKLSYFENGKEFILNFAKSGNMLFLDKNTALEFLENSEVLELSLFNIENLLKNKSFCMSLINTLIRTIILQRELIKDVVFKDLEGRLKSFLQNLANEQNEFIRDKQVLTMPFSVKILSELLGFERQSVSTMFNKLIKDEKLQKIGKNRFILNQS